MKRKRVTQVVSLVFVAVFLAFLALSGAATMLKRPSDASYYENRALASFPQRTREGILDGSYFAGVNTYIQDQTAGRDHILALDTFVNLRLLRRPVVNEIVVRGDTLLPWMDYWIADRDWIQSQADEIAENLTRHARTTEAAGGRFYYVVVPGQYSYFGDRYPQWMNNNAEHAALATECLFSDLDQQWVAHIDMGERFAAMEHPDNLFSLVDHHYTIYGAYEVYHEIMERINADTGWGLDVMGTMDYSVKTLPNPFLGSRARKLFGLWRTDEHLGILEPKKRVTFTRTDIPPWQEEPVESSVLNQLPETETETVTYDVYMGGDMAYTKIQTNRPELPNVLIYGDSFTNPVEGMLYNSFNTLYSLDLRHYDKMTLDEFIQQYRPDVVICLRDYDAMLNLEGNGQ